MNISHEQNATKMLKRARRKYILWWLLTNHIVSNVIIASAICLMWIAIISVSCQIIIGKWWW